MSSVENNFSACSVSPFRATGESAVPPSIIMILATVGMWRPALIAYDGWWRVNTYCTAGASAEMAIA